MTKKFILWLSLGITAIGLSAALYYTFYHTTTLAPKGNAFRAAAEKKLSQSSGKEARKWLMKHNYQARGITQAEYLVYLGRASLGSWRDSGFVADKQAIKARALFRKALKLEIVPQAAGIAHIRLAALDVKDNYEAGAINELKRASHLMIDKHQPTIQLWLAYLSPSSKASSSQAVSVYSSYRKTPGEVYDIRGLTNANLSHLAKVFWQAFQTSNQEAKSTSTLVEVERLADHPAAVKAQDIPQIQAAIENEPRAGWRQYQKALFAIAVGQPRRAGELLRIAPGELTSHPPALQARYHYLRGRAAYSRRQFKEAGEHYQRALALEPKFAPALFWQGQLLATYKKYPQTIKLYRQALRYEKKNGLYWMNLAVVLSYDKKIAKSEAAYKKAEKYQTGDPLLFRNVAVFYDRYLPDPPRAIGYYEEYLRRKPEALDRTQVQEWIEELKR